MLIDIICPVFAYKMFLMNKYFVLMEVSILGQEDRFPGIFFGQKNDGWPR